MRALPAPDAPPDARLLPRDAESPRRRDAAGPARASAVERLAADRAKYVRGRPGIGRGQACEGSSPGPSEGQEGGPRPAARAPGAVARRAIARKPLRPDSLVIYRQKREVARAPSADGGAGDSVRKVTPGPGPDKAPPPPGVSAWTECGPVAAPAPPAAPAPAPRIGPPPADPAAPRGPRRGGHRRSQSDLSSRFSASLAELDAFFQDCGLEPEVVAALGRENFSAASDRGAPKVRSVSVATSDSGFSRRSGGDEGLQADELTEQAPSATSVIERNARIIKWLYTCRRARATPGQGLQGPA